MRRVFALTAALVFVAAASASADTIKVTFVDGVGASYNLSDIGKSGNTTAGQVLLQLNPTGGPTFWGFCVDLLHYYDNSSTQELESPGLDKMSNWNIPPYGGSPSAPGIRAAYLFRQFNGNVDLDNTEAAALQLAIWEVLFETNAAVPYALGTGTATFSSSGAVVTRANQMLAGQFGQADAIWVKTLNDRTNYEQDFMIPEPGSLLLLGAGLMGLAAGVRRRQR